jgi:hypothetical protein
MGNIFLQIMKGTDPYRCTDPVKKKDMGKGKNRRKNSADIKKNKA